MILSAVFSGGARGARAHLEFRGSQKWQSLISAYQSLAITTNTPSFGKLKTALDHVSSAGSLFCSSTVKDTPQLSDLKGPGTSKLNNFEKFERKKRVKFQPRS